MRAAVPEETPVQNGTRQKSGETFLELHHRRPSDVTAGADYREDGPVDFVANSFVLGLDVTKRNGFRYSHGEMLLREVPRLLWDA